MGWQLAHFHQLPCIGTWAHNFPGIVYFHAAIIFWFGTSPLALRIVTLILTCVQAMLVFHLSSHRFSNRFAFYAAISSAALYLWCGTWLSGQLDVFATVFILLGTTICLQWGALSDRKTNTIGQLSIHGVTGALFGLATTFRPTYALFAMVLAAVLAFIHKRKAFRYIIPFGVGFTCVFLLSILPYLFVSGGLHALYFAAIRFNFDVYARPGYATPFRMLLHHRVELASDAVLLLWCIIAIATRSSGGTSRWVLPRANVMLFILYMLVARLSILIMQKFFPQHYAMVLLLTAFLLADLLERLTNVLPILRRQFPAIIAGLMILLLLRHNFTILYIEAIARGEAHPLEYAYRNDANGAADKLLLMQPVVDYLNQESVAGGRIECWGMTPGIYWRTHTASASRFTTMNPLVLQQPGSGLMDYQKRWRREFIDSIVTVRPRYIIIGDSDQLIHSALYYQHYIPGFDSILAMNYLHDTVFPGWTIYRRRE
ncbi:MAG: hypothetical protein Q8922_13085 [Bacteroidota bacterium]|nr:hypothetical protein [Bacteroidota bacterium]